jgi:DNA polymerase-3 subunit epsilon
MTAVDLETHSKDPLEARMVSGAVAFVGGEQPTETVTVLADPGVEIPAEATAVHGISTERARAEGLPAAVALAIVLEAIARRPEGSAVVCMNARYDLTVLELEARRHGLTPLSEREPPLQVVDIRVIDLWLDTYRAGKRTLADLCREYGAKHEAAHDAAADAIAAARVAWWIAHEVDVFRRGRGRDEIRELLALRKTWDRVRHDLPALHEAQVRWAFDQAAGLEEHFAKTGAPKSVDRAWPIASLPAGVTA